MLWSGYLDVIAVAMPILLSLLGVWVSIETPKSETLRQRLVWRGGILLFGLLTVGAIIWQQNRSKAVTEAQFALKYIPSVGVVYADKKLVIYNNAAVNVYLWGDKLDGQFPIIEANPRVIAPNMNYYLIADSIETELTSKLGDSFRTVIPFTLYITNDLKQKWILNFDLLAVASKGNLAIHTQGIGIKQGHW